jgi:protein gp37
MVMSGKTGIAWTDATWNPVVGCTKISLGCKNCYAKTLHDLRHQAYLAGKKIPAQYALPFETVQLMPSRLDMPSHWRAPRRIFVNSVSDLFHPDVPFWFIDQVFNVMEHTPRHTFQLLTKRGAQMLAWCQKRDDPLPVNVWLGVSVENQQTADEQIPYLVKTGAALKFVSCEPLLERVDLELRGRNYGIGNQFVDWVICGGESGANARPMYVGWVRNLLRQCEVSEVPFFFKQWGEWCQDKQPQIKDATGKAFHYWPDGSGSLRVGVAKAGHLLDGEEYREWPEVGNG